jgi:phospholipid-binding lipoprotein MlaA
MMLYKTTAQLCACLLLAASSGCVTLPPNAPRSPQDPWESFNRGVYKFNDALDRAIAHPAAVGYVKVVPNPIRIGVHNFFENLNTTTVMVNDALQGKFLAAGNDLGRFLLDTTVGIGGILDPATQIGMAKNDEDFGQTLGHWGVHPGPFLELPILGPSDLRDAPARVVDTYTNPRQYIHNDYVKYGLYLPDFIDRRVQLLSLDPALQSAYDPYAFVRDAFLQRRAYLVADGKVPDEAPLVDPGEDTSAPVPAPAPTDTSPSNTQAPSAPAPPGAPPEP